MTTAQQSLTNAFPPFPFFVENPVDPHPDGLRENNNQFANDDLVVERQKGVAITPLLAHEKDTNPLPGRCQFFFSDGRQCTMPRSDIHPSLCRYHAEREDQLFGEPGSRTVGAALDLPELYSACRDLTTAPGVNRALGQVFRLLAQRRISRQEAATFCHLAQLLLRSISAMHAEYVSAADRAPATAASALSRVGGTGAAPLLHAQTGDANGVFAQDSDPADQASTGVTLSESESADEGKTSRDFSSQRKNGAGRPRPAASGARASMIPPVFAPPELDSQIARDEQLHKLRSQPTHNEHLRNPRT